MLWMATASVRWSGPSEGMVMPLLQDNEGIRGQLTDLEKANASLTSDLDATCSELNSVTAKASSLQHECQELQSTIQKQSSDADALQQLWAEAAASKDKALQASACTASVLLTVCDDLAAFCSDEKLLRRREFNAIRRLNATHSVPTQHLELAVGVLCSALLAAYQWHDVACAGVTGELPGSYTEGAGGTGTRGQSEADCGSPNLGSGGAHPGRSCPTASTPPFPPPHFCWYVLDCSV